VVSAEALKFRFEHSIPNLRATRKSCGGFVTWEIFIPFLLRSCFLIIISALLQYSAVTKFQHGGRRPTRAGGSADTLYCGICAVIFPVVFPLQKLRILSRFFMQCKCGFTKHRYFHLYLIQSPIRFDMCSTCLDSLWKGNYFRAQLWACGQRCCTLPLVALIAFSHQ
jgi:hypothetical protein